MSLPLPADANCDARVSVADVVATQVLVARGVASLCGSGDANEDGGVDNADLDTLIEYLFAPSNL